MDLEKIIHSVYEGVLAAGGWAPVLEELRALTDSVQATFIIYDRASELTQVNEIAQLDEPLIRDYVSHFAASDPVRPCVDAMAVGDWFLDERDIGSFNKRHSDFYQLFLREHGIGSIMCTPLLNDHTTLAGLAFQRATDRAPYSCDTADLLRELMPHLARAARLRHRIGQLTGEAQFCRAVLEKIRMPMLVVHADGKAVPANWAGEAWLREHSTAPHAQAVQQALSQLAHTVAIDGAAHAATLQFAHATFRLVGLPLPPSHPIGNEHAGGTILIAISGAREVGPSANVLGRLFRLTPAELRLLEAWKDASTLEEAALHLGLAVPTVRSQMRAIFRKTGCDNQVALARLLAAIPGLI